MKRLLELLYVTFFLMSPQFVQATAATDPLLVQIELINNISQYVERMDLPRLYVIRSTVDTVVKDMQENVRTGRQEITFQTMRLLQNLIIQYRYSQVFLGWTQPRAVSSIYTFRTELYLNELQKLSQDLVKTYGYDDSPYTQITANTFRQIQRLLKALENQSLDPKLHDGLKKLWAPIGETIAIAEQGDRPNTFARAIPVVRQIQTLYPMFYLVQSTNAGFPLILELQGLAEFYAEFAQIENE